MRPFRSPILGALLALACMPGVDAQVTDQREVEDALCDALLWLEVAERVTALPLLQADVWATHKAEALASQSLPTRAPRPGAIARRLAELVSTWANNGRKSIVIRDEAVAGEWRARTVFMGPGLYRAETHRPASGGERGEVIIREAATCALAWTLAAGDAKARAAADAAMIPTGHVENGPYSKLTALSYDEFTAKYGIRDDLVKQPLPPEQRAKMEARMETVLAERLEGLDKVTIEPLGSLPRFVERFAAAVEREHPPTLVGIDMARETRRWESSPGVLMGPDGLITVAEPQVIDLNPAYESGAPMATIGLNGIPLAHVIFGRDQLRPDDIHTTRPRHKMKLHEFSTTPPVYQQHLTVSSARPDWPPRYSAKPKPAKPPIDPEVKAEWRSDQRQRKALKAKKRARRGFA